jgi:hypothetical protein
MTELVVDGATYARLEQHLFQADRDEHAAVILAGVTLGSRLTLLARELHLVDEADFEPGTFGYRQTAAHRVAELSVRAADEGLAYVALHSHPGARTEVSLSRDDRRAHERLFPHLSNIVRGLPVAGLALGSHSAAGEVWLPGDLIVEVDAVRVVSPTLRINRPRRRSANAPEPRFERQARMFGTEGQDRLRELHVAVVGVGGGGSMLIEQLAHLGVGAITAVDFDTVESTNLSRIVGASERDARSGTPKVDVAARLVRSIDPTIAFTPIRGDIADVDVATALTQVDFIFLATDTTTSRLVFNAIVHRFFIPGVQIGAKVETQVDGTAEVYVAIRPVFPDRGCLDCAGLIDPMRLQQEARTEEERHAQNYLDVDEVVDPSVISLNGIAASHGVTTMLLWAVGLAIDPSVEHRLVFPVRGNTFEVDVEPRAECSFCSQTDRSMYARAGSAEDLPIRRPARLVERSHRRVSRRYFATRPAGISSYVRRGVTKWRRSIEAHRRAGL